MHCSGKPTGPRKTWTEPAFPTAVRSWRLFRHFYRRELTTRYLGSVSGFIWPFVQPLALLAIYAYVFVVIFNARVPEARGAGFVPYLAIAFWPWTAFSESLQRAVPVIQGNAGLISKVAIPLNLLVDSTVAATFTLQMVGYAAVLLVLAVAGVPIHASGLPGAVLVLGVLFCFTLGLAYLLSALQVFVRDLEHGLTPVLMFWFFGTPILYSVSLIPEQYRWVADINPMTWYVSTLRELLLYGEWTPSLGDLAAVCIALGLLLLGRFVFQRLSTRFEDFL